jgi:hypothetical protein
VSALTVPATVEHNQSAEKLLQAAASNRHKDSNHIHGSALAMATAPVVHDTTVPAAAVIRNF